MSRSLRSLRPKLACKALFTLLLLPRPAEANPNESKTLSVSPRVPGLDQSPRYRFRVRELSSQTWKAPFAFFSHCRQGNLGCYSDSLGDWAHTYCNFELKAGTLIEVEITRLDGSGNAIPVQTAVAHPRRKVLSWRVENGKAYIAIEPGTIPPNDGPWKTLYFKPGEARPTS